MSEWRKRGYIWVTLVLFLASLAGHWAFGWYAYVDEEASHGRPPELSGYAVEMGRDTLENWQSEFLQLIWQVLGLSVLLCVGSPQSKEGDQRLEAKVDALLLRLDPGARDLLAELDRRYPKA